MNRSLIQQLLAVSMCLHAGPLVFAAGQNCAAMEESGPQWFAAQLDGLQATYQGGNSQGAYQQLQEAMFGLPRRADVSLDARCVGTAGWQRMYQLRQGITQSLGQTAENTERLASPEGALDWYVTGDNQADARRVIPKLTPTTEGTTWIISRLRSEIATLDRAAAAGFDLLPEERAARDFWQRGVDGTVRYAKGKVDQVLQAEAGLLTREAIDEELKSEQSQMDRQNIAADFFGDPSLAPDKEVLRETNRAQGSLKMLKTARDWAMAVSKDEAAPVNSRALDRGDAILARAGSADLGLESRDALYQSAADYFKFAGNFERQQTVERARAQIAPALKAEISQRNAKLDKQAQKLRGSAQEMKHSMEKTEVQKNSFKDEADALEDELGF